MENRKRVLAVLLAGTMVAGSLAGCGSQGGTDTPATDTPVAENNTTEQAGTETTATGETTEGAETSAKTMEELAAMEYDERSSYLYEQNLGEFYEYYQEAKAELDDIPKRYAMMAVAEAKLLESGVIIPNITRGGNYAITRVAPHTKNSTMWGNDNYRYHNQVVTTEFIKAEHVAEMRAKWEELRGTGTYEDWVKEYLVEKGYELKDTYANNLYNTDPTTWDVLSTSQSADSEAIINTYDGLMEYDMENILQPALAESYEISDDGLTYTFHIREGVEWVDSQGRKVADVQADDWVAGMQHMMDAMGGLEFLVDGVIKNATGYINNEITDFSEVGVKAVDEHTLEYTLEAPCPYFLTMLGYGVFAPMSRDYYTSQGGKFGADFDKSAADYTYGQSPDNIAYCGPYLVSNFTSKNIIVFTANESYWNKDNINIKTITWPYEDGSDTLKLYNDAKAGTVDGTGLNSAQVEAAKADGLFDEYSYVSDTDGSTFPNYYNLYRTAYANANDETKVVSQLTDEDKERANAALGNVDFRLAVTFATDKASMNAQTAGEELKNNRLRNSYTPATFVTLDAEVTIDINGTATTFPEGTYYGEVMQAQLDADGFPIKVYNEELASGDGYDGWYNPEVAKEYLAKAKEALAAQGYTIDKDNPITIELVYAQNNEPFTNRANAYKQSVEAALDGEVIIGLVPASDTDEWYYSGYFTDYGYEANYNVTDVSGWSPDYGDPSSYLDVYLPDYAGYVTRSLGIF
ncbi:MAG: peptide ABC transporter substrate-binding protein [Lachnospiraceae bacterium]|nr:peptide ABC transporter substrate-binding protein [Lachnospiraceae bacterium]